MRFRGVKTSCLLYTSYQLGLYDIQYDRWRVALNVPVFHQSLDYRRGGIDTLMHGTWVYFRPDASFRHMSEDGKHDFRLSAGYQRAQAVSYTHLV